LQDTIYDLYYIKSRNLTNVFLIGAHALFYFISVHQSELKK